LDPPFNSNATYNVLFREKDGSFAASQLQAFGDTWQWDEGAAAAYLDTVERGPTCVSDALQAFKTMLGPSNMLAYLSMMAPRLVELRRVLKSTGSLYLHCDPTASHYLKLLLDAVFGVANYRDEITWLRSRNPKGSQYKNTRWGSSTDTLLFYSKSDRTLLHVDGAKSVADDGEVQRRYPSSDERGRWADGPILRSDSMGARPNLVYEYKGFTPGPAGWRVELDKLAEIDSIGDLYWTATKRPRRKLRPDTVELNPLGNCWMDISPINSQAQERLGYPTQKPEALLARIIKASSNEGEIVLDPFCGCGTAIAAAEALNRRWVGIDITQAAMVVIKQQRLSKISASTYEVIGEPASVPDAEELAIQEPYQFQWWAVGKLSAHPVERKKGSDRGIDGRLDFHDDHRETKKIMISVKAGHLLAQHVRELRGVMEREKAEMGVLISREMPTKAMRAEAASAGAYRSPWRTKPYPRIQLITIADLFKEHPIERPGKDISENVSFKKGPHKERRRGVQGDLFRKQG
jgi:site-specific DNA-methyltransferase (adenine-specific)